MQLPDRRKVFQRRHRREEIEAQLRRAQIEDQYITDDTSSEEEESSESRSENEVVHGESFRGESEEEVVNDESEEEVVNDESVEEVVNDESEEVLNDESEEEVNESENEDDESEEEADETENEEEADESENEEEADGSENEVVHGESFRSESEEEVVNDESEEEVVIGESEEEVVIGESEEEVINDESEEEVNESENEDDKSEEEADESENEEDEPEKIDDLKKEDKVVDEEENNMSFNEKSLTNSTSSHYSSNNISLDTSKVEVDDSEKFVVDDESYNETFNDNTPLAKNNNVLMNKINSDDNDKPQFLYRSNFNMNYRQCQVVEWMITRESQKPYGGIIATDMGTTDCKITILMNLLSKSYVPDSNNTQSDGETDLDETVFSKGCTLILCPKSSIDHWKDCFDNKIKPGSLNVWIHYGRNRNISLQDLTQKDIVITSVTMVLTGFRDKENNPLYQIKWNRIILDDNKLYNYKQQTSKALCQLSGICHWVLSGSTIIDNDDDRAIYGLIKFINYKPFNIFENWKKWIKANPTVSLYEKFGHLYYEKKIV